MLKIKKYILLLLISNAVVFSSGTEALTAVQILERVEETINAPRDQNLTVRLILIDRQGHEKVREMKMLQKGSDHRLIKFTAPADQKGIAFLALPDDVMYLYLPAFKKTRRIAGHIKHTKFAGTDFTYEDMEVKSFSEKFVPSLLSIDREYYRLQLIPKPDLTTDYSKLIITVTKNNFFPVRIEYYDKKNSLRKIMTRNNIDQIQGYWLAKESEMVDLKSNHKTKMIIEKAVFDQKLPDDFFTERYLKR